MEVNTYDFEFVMIIESILEWDLYWFILFIYKQQSHKNVIASVEQPKLSQVLKYHIWGFFVLHFPKEIDREH